MVLAELVFVAFQVMIEHGAVLVHAGVAHGDGGEEMHAPSVSAHFIYLWKGAVGEDDAAGRGHDAGL